MAGYDYESKAVRAAMENNDRIAANNRASKLGVRKAEVPIEERKYNLYSKIRNGTASPNEIATYKAMEEDAPRYQNSLMEAQWNSDVKHMGGDVLPTVYKGYGQIAADNENMYALVEAKKRGALPIGALTLPTKKLDVVAAPTQQVVEPGVAQIAAADIIHQTPAVASPVQAATATNPPQAPTAVAASVQADTKPAPAGAPSKQQGPKKPSYEAQGIRALQEGLNAYFGNNALKVDGIMGPKTQAMLRGYEEDFANKAGLAGRQAPIEAVVSQQAPVQQPSFLGMKLDQQATEAAWDKWRSNDAPEGYIPTAVYR
jgi:hypothetical protein